VKKRSSLSSCIFFLSSSAAFYSASLSLIYLSSSSLFFSSSISILYLSSFSASFSSSSSIIRSSSRALRLASWSLYLASFFFLSLSKLSSLKSNSSFPTASDASSYPKGFDSFSETFPEPPRKLSSPPPKESSSPKLSLRFSDPRLNESSPAYLLFFERTGLPRS